MNPKDVMTSTEQDLVTTTRQKPRARSRIAAATMVAAGAIAAGALSTASPANAADSYIALAYQLPSLGQGEFSGVGISTTWDGARVNSLEDCKNNGGNTAQFLCETYVVARNECAAFAILGSNWSTATAPSRQEAEQLALQKNPGSHIGVSGCSHIPVPPRKVPFTLPPLAPTQQ